LCTLYVYNRRHADATLSSRREEPEEEKHGRSWPIGAEE
jgi:hypothetical protein